MKSPTLFSNKIFIVLPQFFSEKSKHLYKITLQNTLHATAIRARLMIIMVGEKFQYQPIAFEKLAAMFYVFRKKRILHFAHDARVQFTDGGNVLTSCYRRKSAYESLFSSFIEFKSRENAEKVKYKYTSSSSFFI